LKRTKTYAMNPPPKAFENARDDFDEWLSAFCDPLACWLAQGDDCALLDELFRFVRYVKVERDDLRVLDATRQRVTTMVSSGVTPLLSVGCESDWWAMPREIWLSKLDLQRRQMR
jgi:hypothetical protein